MTAFEDLYRKYAGAVYCFALRLSGNAAHAEDITSETFLRVWTAPDRLRIATVKAYLFAIARNLYLQDRRTAGRSQQLDSLPEPRAAPVDWAMRQQAERVHKALKTLPEPDRTALLLRAEGELSYEEIAQILGLTPVAARVKVHRARMRLSEMCRSKEVEK